MARRPHCFGSGPHHLRLDWRPTSIGRRRYAMAELDPALSNGKDGGSLANDRSDGGCWDGRIRRGHDVEENFCLRPHPCPDAYGDKPGDGHAHKGIRNLIK
jgi:hypothetical protein